jgi:hypothetical protein
MMKLAGQLAFSRERQGAGRGSCSFVNRIDGLILEDWEA